MSEFLLISHCFSNIIPISNQCISKFGISQFFPVQAPSHLASNSNSHPTSTVPTIACYIQPTEISDDLLCESVRSLNNKQRIAYDTVLSWCRIKVKNIRSLKLDEIKPIYLFITGGGGSGKSHVINAIYHTAVKTFRHVTTNTDLPTVLLMAPTGVSAINIGGTTINTALAIPKETGHNLPAMSDQKKTQMRLSLSNLKLIIIDEVSMVSNTTLLHIHQTEDDIWLTKLSTVCWHKCSSCGRFVSVTTNTQKAYF